MAGIRNQTRNLPLESECPLCQGSTHIVSLGLMVYDDGTTNLPNTLVCHFADVNAKYTPYREATCRNRNQKMLNQTYWYFLGVARFNTDTSFAKPRSAVWVSDSKSTPLGVGSTASGGIFCNRWGIENESEILYFSYIIKSEL